MSGQPSYLMGCTRWVRCRPAPGWLNRIELVDAYPLLAILLGMQNKPAIATLLSSLLAAAGLSAAEREYASAGAPAELSTQRYVSTYEHGSEAPPIDLAPYASYSADDPMGEFDIERAASFIDGVAEKWGQKHGCVTCHTNGHYLIAPAGIFRDRQAALNVRAFAEEWVDSWKIIGLPITDDIVVAPAAFLAINNMQMDGELRPATVRALDQAWALQSAEGHWPNWVKCNWPPFEQDDHYGVTLVTIAMGMAPEHYATAEPAKTGIKRLKTWLANNGPQEVHHRAMLLWAGSLHPELISASEREAWIQELLSLQKPSGGWSSGDLGRWRQRAPESGSVAHLDADALARDYPPVMIAANGDGYGTGFVMYALLQGGLSASHAQMQQGLTWLKNNQQADGKWFTNSLRNEHETSNFLTHTGTTFALKVLDQML
jgi:squalene-hopene/tetraprenyl-beta-curcumene cyclase